MPLILVSGLTAAGKTTHSRLLAERLGWRYWGMSTIMREAISRISSGDTRPSSDREWDPRIDALRSTNDEIDLLADQLCQDHLRGQDNAVVDAWAQPWLHQGPAVRVWIESARDARIRKAQVTALRLDIEAPTAQEIDAKDSFSARQFRRLYGVRYGYDSRLFDICFDNTEYIPVATIGASDAGIQRSQEVFYALTSALVD